MQRIKSRDLDNPMVLDHEAAQQIGSVQACWINIEGYYLSLRAR